MSRSTFVRIAAFLLSLLAVGKISAEPVETRVLSPGETLDVSFEISGVPAIIADVEGSFHGVLEIDRDRLSYLPKLSFFTMGSDLLHVSLRTTRFGSTDRRTLRLVAADRPGAALYRNTFEAPDALDGIMLGDPGRFAQTPEAAVEGLRGVEIDAGTDPAYLFVVEPLAALPDVIQGDHSSGTKTEIEPPWPPGGTIGIPGQPQTAAVIRLNGGSSGQPEVDVVLTMLPDQQAYRYSLRLDGSPAGLAEAPTVGRPPHTLDLRTFSLGGSFGYQLRVNGEVASQLTGSSSELSPVRQVAAGLIEPTPQWPLSLDDLSFRNGQLEASHELVLYEPFDDNVALEGWSIAQPEQIDLVGKVPGDDMDLRVAAVQPATAPAFIERPVEPALDAVLVRFRLDTSTLVVPVGEHIALFEARDGGTVQSRVRLERAAFAGHRLRLSAFDDQGVGTGQLIIGISPASATFELRWQRSRGGNHPTGRLSLWVDGIRRGHIERIDDANRSIDLIRFGTFGASSDTIAGKILLDDIEYWTPVD